MASLQVDSILLPEEVTANGSRASPPRPRNARMRGGHSATALSGMSPSAIPQKQSYERGISGQT
ncbi:hypothetical protein [Capsulimonas corticalis]|uniref:hypothetical protein n=1 Tax=Capsulimonas corticalis TaxID=2219043 RepID=UPI000F6484D8|nr:hypothetical protein [Capsulimonas corticalis]